jgi:signal transduction histidine kinase/phage shock protein PspC (stress-responsive transcriptional regulator)
MRQQSDPPLPPFGFQNQPGRPPWHDQDQRQGPPLPHELWQRRWRRHRGDGGPLRRDQVDRLAGGVAAGLATWRGFSPTTVRIVLVIVALITRGWAVPFYLAAWLIIPGKDNGESIGNRARHDTRGVAFAVAFASLLAFFLFVASVLNDTLITEYGWPQVGSVAALTIIWRNAPDDERASMRRLIQPLEGISGAAQNSGSKLRIAVAAVLLVIGVGWLASSHAQLALLSPLSGVLFVTAGIVVLLGPWWLRIARDLVLERQARARAEERADIAARVHDSVLQTLALIQRRADDPQAVVQLARSQERELRSWLFEGRAPGDSDVTSVAAGVKEIQGDVEARHGVPVEVVTVGDCPLDEHLNALLGAAREATVNAAKWSGAPVISLFAEVEPDKVTMTVRDRGKGFDPAAVSADRKGLAESVHGRMTRHGGEAAVQSAPGEGTKVTLSMPRSTTPRDRDQRDRDQAAPSDTPGWSRNDR